jgi:hypothetical protein
MQSEAVREIKACWGQVACGRPGESAELERTVGEVFVVLRDPIYRYVFSTVRNAGDAEDLTQEAFIRLLRDLRKGHAIENVKAWLFRVAHNLVIDFSRRSPVPESLDAAANQRMTEEMPDPSPSAEERALDWASRRWRRKSGVVWNSGRRVCDTGRSRRSSGSRFPPCKQPWTGRLRK